LHHSLFFKLLLTVKSDTRKELLEMTRYFSFIFITIRYAYGKGEYTMVAKKKTAKKKATKKKSAKKPVMKKVKALAKKVAKKAKKVVKKLAKKK
jgi:hypothetical protein